MIFMLFAVAIAALFFVGSLILLRLGQRLGLRYRKRSGTEGTGGLATVEGSIFGLMGLLLAFTISGALQRFDDRRQLVIQEATAATTAYDRLSLFGGDDARRLQTGLKEYVRARIDLYRMAHDFLLLQRAVPPKNTRRRSSTLCCLALVLVVPCSRGSGWQRAQGTVGYTCCSLQEP